MGRGVEEGSMIPKSAVMKSLEALPDDATIEEIIEHLYFVWKMERRLEQADSGAAIPHDEAREHMRARFKC